MSRVAVCLFYIAILHYGIPFTQANETTTEGVPKNNETVTTQTTEVVPVTENSTTSTTTEATKSNGTEDKQNITKRAAEESQATVTQRSISGFLKTDPAEGAKMFLDIPKNILEPVKSARERIAEALSKGFDTAKELAGGTFDFLRNSVKGTI